MAIFGGRGKQQQSGPELQGPGPGDGLPPDGTPSNIGGGVDPTVPATQPFDPTVIGTLGGGESTLPPVETSVESSVPMPPMPTGPVTNTPLAIPGTFTLPGSTGAAAFHSPGFFQNRVVRGPQNFGPGSTLVGGSGDFSGLGDASATDAVATDQNPQEEELIRRIVNGLGKRRG